MILSSERAEVGMNGVNRNNEGSRLGSRGKRKKKKEGMSQRLCWGFRERVLNSREEKEVQGCRERWKI